MKVLVVNEKHQLELRETPKPEIGPYDALVRIEACGLCGTTDRELIKGTQPYHNASHYPAILGHESVGRVVETGAKVKTFKPGMRVTRPYANLDNGPRHGLYRCWGGFAEYGVVRDRAALLADGDASALNDYTLLRQNVVPEGLSLSAAVAAMALAETASWLGHLPSLAEKTVCVAGSGSAGLSLALWSKLAGAAKVIVLGRRASRLAAAADFGADATVDVSGGNPSEAIRRLAPGGVDVFCEAVGQKDQVRLGLSVVRPGGIVAVYGVVPGGYEISWKDVPPDVRLMTPSADEHVRYNWVADLIRLGAVPVEKFMTRQWPLADFGQAFAALEKGEAIKGMLVFG